MLGQYRTSNRRSWRKSSECTVEKISLRYFDYSTSYACRPIHQILLWDQDSTEVDITLLQRLHRFSDALLGHGPRLSHWCNLMESGKVEHALLDVAGWVPGPDGIRVKDGVRLAPVGYFFTGSTWQKLSEYTQAELRKIGVDLQVDQDLGEALALVADPEHLPVTDVPDHSGRVA